jgi:ArsR family transcriptional regulator, arsenate/arsenite/antimonite-responsive transcriptional repressor
MAQLRKYTKIKDAKPAASPGPAGTDACGAGECCSGLAACLDPRLFKALGDRTRVELLARLASACAGLSVSEVASGLPVDLSVVSRHLAQLRDAGVVRAERRGKEVVYSVLYPQLAHSLRALADAIDHCCPGEKDKDSPQRRRGAEKKRRMEK